MNLQSCRKKGRTCPVLIPLGVGAADQPGDAAAALGAELLQTLTFPKPWEGEIRAAPREENAGTTPALGLLCSEQEKTNILLLN